MGGELAAALALARPERIVATVLIAPAGWSVGLGGIADTMYPDKAEAIGWYLSSRAFLLPEHDLEWLGEPDSAASYTLMGDPAYRRATARVLQEFDFRGLRERFAEIQRPVLLVWGVLDPVIPFAIADSLARTLPCSRLVGFPSALHRPQLEIPDTVATEILRFVESPGCGH
jgi:pimeloyl-ACP methyl ester carboxylesterase